MEKKSLSKIKLLLIILIAILILGSAIGITLLCITYDYSFLVLFFMNLPFSILIYYSFYYLNKHFENKQKASKTFLISVILRFISILLSLVLSFIFLYFTSKTTMPSILYILVPVILMTLSYVLGVVIK